MHKKLLNDAIFYLTISAQGPFLIKSGTETWDPATPDMEFVRTRHGRLGETVFIPGSSLKGTLRSYSEKIAHTLDVYCCDPFDKKLSCSNLEKIRKLVEAHDTAAIYNQSCVACKLYGSNNISARAAFADAYPSKPIDPKQLTKRTAVAIDRVLGSVAVGPFDFEALISGDFVTEIRLHNFELWQLGLLGLTLRDLCMGRINMGYGKSRGFGKVSARLDKLELRSIADGGLAATGGMLTVKGIGAMLNETERQSYGIGPSESEPVSISSNLNIIDDLIGSSMILERKADSAEWCSPEALELFSKCVREAWPAYRSAHRTGGGGNA
jgi:CRISPR-associated protein Csm3